MSSETTKVQADDIVRVKQSTLIELHHDAEKLPLKTRGVKAALSGNYLSAFKGRGMEFDEARPYQPGDDIRSIDWRVTARTGKTHTKMYREERERPVLLWVDYRRSMFFGTQNYFKSVLAAKTAALLAWSAAQHGDRLGGLIFSEELHQELRPQRGKAGTLHFIKKLSEHPAWDDYQHTQHDEASGAQALRRLRRVARPGSLIFLISDFRYLDSSAESALAHLSRHNDVVMLFINDPLEAQLPPAGFYRVSNGKNEVNLNTRNTKNRNEYAERFHQHEQTFRDLSNKLGMYFLNISTDMPLVSHLQKGLGLKK
jgi:uncharacterized protein (DUF58 family)